MKIELTNREVEIMYKLLIKETNGLINDCEWLEFNKDDEQIHKITVAVYEIEPILRKLEKLRKE